MMFSVLISVYLHEKPTNFFAAMESIFHQTLPPDEVVLIVDGPVVPDIAHMIDRYISEFPDLLKVVRHEKCIGLGAALKAGLQNCTHEIVARMDSDDICALNRFEIQYQFLLKNLHISIVGSNMEEFSAFPGDLLRYKKLPEDGLTLREYAKYRNPLNHPTIMFRKSAVLLSGGYNSEFPLFEDYSLYIRMIKDGALFYNIQDNLLFFRLGDGNATFKRRSGISYFKTEFRFLVFAYKIGHLTAFEFLFSAISKSFIRLLPAQFIGFIYKKILRSKTNH